jgi:uncharacterized protein (TIGR00290 family)
MRRTLVAWSGGKDSALALAAARKDGSLDVVGLLTAVTREFDRVSIHGTRRSILLAQAHRLGLALFEAAIQVGAHNAAYELAWSTALNRARDAAGPIDAIVYGDLFLADVRAYRERQCEQLRVEPIFPIWGQPTAEVAKQVIREGYIAYLTCVDTQQLDASFAGRLFDADLLRELPASVDPCGERGEFHTVVVDAPTYGSAISVRRGERVLREARFNYCDFDMVPT